jgi:GNAT superfamily N-acetyltransferase
MAALPDRYDDPVVELRRVSAEQLAAILDEETLSWQEELDWDFRSSADLVRRFVHMQALSGFALMCGPQMIGYSYYVCEEGKGLIGDLYVMREHRTVETEDILLRAVIDAILRSPGVRRVESQLMMLSSPLARNVPRENSFRCYPRYFMEAPLGLPTLPEKVLPGITVSAWQVSRQEETARLIAASYKGHIDSQINDQYRSPGGARRFLMNIVQFPGCGTFFGPASYTATDTTGRQLRGVSLASLVAPDVGHITQVCVSPADRSTGLGYELMRRSLLSLAANGCRAVSLTVTAANQPALSLYERMGFALRREFAAYVWEPR